MEDDELHCLKSEDWLKETAPGTVFPEIKDPQGDWVVLHSAAHYKPTGLTGQNLLTVELSGHVWVFEICVYCFYKMKQSKSFAFCTPIPQALVILYRVRI